jgi:hypothetical protein
MVITANDEERSQQATGALQLSASSVATDEDRRVTWEETVVDNEYMNKKKSKSIFCKEMM